MNVPPSKKATGITLFRRMQKLRADLRAQARYSLQLLATRARYSYRQISHGIGDDAVSAVIPEAVIYMPFAELVDIAKEIERLQKGGRASDQGACPCQPACSANEKFVSKAPQAKIDEEKAKLEKYTQMMEQVKARLAQLK